MRCDARGLWGAVRSRFEAAGGRKIWIQLGGLHLHCLPRGHLTDSETYLEGERDVGCGGIGTLEAERLSWGRVWGGLIGELRLSKQATTISSLLFE